MSELDDSDKTVIFFYLPKGRDSEDDEQPKSTQEHPMGYNYLNPDGNWEPLAHGAHSWDDSHFYKLEDDHFPVKYSQKDECFVAENSCFPVFNADYLKNTECLKRFFRDGYTPSCLLFVIFTTDELRFIGIEVPNDHTGYRINTSSGMFERVPMPPNHGWNPIFRRYEPLCTVEHVPGRKCTSGLLDFWSVYGNYMTGLVPLFCSSEAHRPDEAHSSENPLRLLCSYNSGPCCIEGCYCYDCSLFYPPEEAENHESVETSPGSGYFTMKCDRFYRPR
jgi:hypothetical protein